MYKIMLRLATIAFSLFALYSPIAHANQCAFNIRRLLGNLNEQEKLALEAEQKLNAYCKACVAAGSVRPFVVVYQLNGMFYHQVTETYAVKGDQHNPYYILFPPGHQDDPNNAFIFQAVASSSLQAVITEGSHLTLTLKKPLGTVTGVITKVGKKRKFEVLTKGAVERVEVDYDQIDWIPTLQNLYGAPIFAADPQPKADGDQLPQGQPVPPPREPNQARFEQALPARQQAEAANKPAVAPVKTAKELWGTPSSTVTQRASEWGYHYPLGPGGKSLFLRIAAGEKVGIQEILAVFAPAAIKDLKALEGAVFRGLWIIDRHGHLRMAPENILATTGQNHNSGDGNRAARPLIKHGDLAPVAPTLTGLQRILVAMVTNGILTKDEANALSKELNGKVTNDFLGSGVIDAAVRKLPPKKQVTLLGNGSGFTDAEIVKVLFDSEDNYRYVQGSGTHRGEAYIGGEIKISISNGKLVMRFDLSSSYSHSPLAGKPSRYTRENLDKALTIIRDRLALCIEVTAKYPQ